MERRIKLFFLVMASLMSQSICSQVLIGDANNDGIVSISDVSSIVDHILGATPQTFNTDAADYNNDGTITIADVSEIVEFILNIEPSIQVVKERKNITLTSGDFTITAKLGNNNANNYYDVNSVFNFKHLYYNPTKTRYYMGDDIAPVHVLNYTLGANHGLTCYFANIENHGLENKDVGTAWTHDDGTVYYILRIVDSNTIQMISENRGSVISPKFVSLKKGNITDGLRQLTITSVSASQLKPSDFVEDQQIILDGYWDITKADGTFHCNTLEIREKYYVCDPIAVIDSLISHVGNDNPPSFHADKLLTIENTYRFLPGNNILVFSTVTSHRKMDFDNMMFTQSSLGDVTNAQYYIPNSLPIKGYDFRKPLTVEWSSSIPKIYTTNSLMADPDNPVNRVLAYSNNFAFAIGFLPIYGVGQDLKNFTNRTFEIRNNSGKIYPHGVDTKIGKVLEENQSYSAAMYRALIPYSSRIGNRMSMYHFNVDGEEYVYVDYSQSMDDHIDIGSSFNGKTIEPIETVNTQVVNNMYHDGFDIKADYIEGETCYAVVRIR